ncbi:divalent-cation tolerance protein CutA [Candidatus Dependentiae bacterium]
MEEMVLIYVTNPSKEKALEVAKHLLDKRLVACTNVISATSMYWWEGALENENEFILIAKTVEENFDSVRHEILEIHDYQIPCIIKIPVIANQQYVQWLRSEIKT